MFTVEKIQSLNELELMVYEYVIQHKSVIPYMRIRELAEEVHVSTTTVLRFCKKIGCDGYSEFKYKLKESIGQKSVRQIPEDTSEMKAFLDRVENQEFQEKLEKAASMIAKADRVIMVGIGNSGCIGEYAARYFTNLGKFSLYITDAFYPINMADASENTALPSGVSAKPAEAMIYAPMNGTVKALEDVDDPVFSSGGMGQGIAVIPDEGKLYAPFDGTVSMVFDTLHAVGLENGSGVEMLIHIGLDTVKLNGKYFSAKVSSGDTVKKGDLLIEFDMEAIAKEYSMDTPVIITNSDDFEELQIVAKPGPVKAGNELLKVRG